jgi:hypothetical protein
MSVSQIGKKRSDLTKLKISLSKSGANHPCWKGGRHLTKKGYIIVFSPYHPFANNRYVLEHRLICEKLLGRFLEPEERVHHIDFNRANNNPDNLIVFETPIDHMNYHYSLRKNPFLKTWLKSNII